MTSLNPGTFLLAAVIAIIVVGGLRLITSSDPRDSAPRAESAVGNASLSGGSFEESAVAEADTSEGFSSLRRAALEVLLGTAVLALLLVGAVWVKGRYSY